MTFVHRLDEVSMQDVATCGGKAARLGEAMRLGCPVPPGMVLSTELYRRFMRQGGLQGEVVSILATMQPSTMPHFQAAEWAIQSAFSVRRVPDEVVSAIREAYHAVGAPRVVVRSSATNADSPYQSFVGQHGTFLDINSEQGAIEAVLGCWMSLYSAKSLSYAYHFKVDLFNSSMAVLLQPMIEPTMEGALFTADPITGNPDVFLLEVHQGPGVGVYRLNPYERQPGELRVWGQLRDMGLLLDEHHQSYQAVQWAFAQGRIHLLRVRPATRIPPYLPQTGEDVGAGSLPLELVKHPKLDPRAMRPYSWYHRSRSPRLNAAYYRDVSPLFTPHAGREEYYICGYLYTRYQRSAIPAVQDAVGLRRYLYSLMRLYKARTLDREYRVLWREKRPRLEELNALDLTTLSDRALSGFLQEVAALNDAFYTQVGRLGNSNWMISNILSYLHSHWVSEAENYHTLLWTRDNQANRCDEELCHLARARYASDHEREAAFGAFYRRYRHLFLRDQPLGEWQDICRLQEDEATARDKLLKWMQSSGPSACEQLDQMESERVRMEQRTLAKLPQPRRYIYRHVLRLARRYAPLQSDREEPVLLCRLLERDVVWEVGRRLQAAGLATLPQEGCLLTYQEIIDWLGGIARRDAVVRLLIERRDLARRWMRYSAPEVLDSQRRELDEKPQSDVSAEDQFQGRAISPGRAEGTARVISTLGEATNVLSNEILICHEPLFELSPLFGLVSAVVSERGGLLDHASVLTREYGVPAVFGVDGVMKHIRTGDHVVVDAYRGIITRRRPEPEWESL